MPSESAAEPVGPGSGQRRPQLVLRCQERLKPSLVLVVVLSAVVQAGFYLTVAGVTIMIGSAGTLCQDR